jgi:integrase/recombinase XerD
VSIEKLQQIHAATHPARLKPAQDAQRNEHTSTPTDPRQALLKALDAESDDENER